MEVSSCRLEVEPSVSGSSRLSVFVVSSQSHSLSDSSAQVSIMTSSHPSLFSERKLLANMKNSQTDEVNVWIL